MKKTLTVSFCFLSSFFSFAQQTIIQYLSGTDKDHTVSWDFLCTKGRNSGRWNKIPVPSNWEMQDFGTFNYYQGKNNPDEQGLYQYIKKAAYGDLFYLLIFKCPGLDSQLPGCYSFANGLCLICVVILIGGSNFFLLPLSPYRYKTKK